LNQLANSGANQTMTTTKPPSQRSMPPSTRQFVKDYASFHAHDAAVTGKALAQAKAIKNGSDSSCQKPPSTRQFAQAYKAFYDVDNMNDAAMDQARAIKNGSYAGGAGLSQTAPKSFRIKTGTREDPNFRANEARFHGTESTPDDEIYKNYRAFYGGATPNVHKAGHMG